MSRSSAQNWLIVIEHRRRDSQSQVGSSVNWLSRIIKAAEVSADSRVSVPSQEILVNLLAKEAKTRSEIVSFSSVKPKELLGLPRSVWLA